MGRSPAWSFGRRSVYSVMFVVSLWRCFGERNRWAGGVHPFLPLIPPDSLTAPPSPLPPFPLVVVPFPSLPFPLGGVELDSWEWNRDRHLSGFDSPPMIPFPTPTGTDSLLPHAAALCNTPSHPTCPLAALGFHPCVVWVEIIHSIQMTGQDDAFQ